MFSRTLGQSGVRACEIREHFQPRMGVEAEVSDEDEIDDDPQDLLFRDQA